MNNINNNMENLPDANIDKKKKDKKKFYLLGILLLLLLLVGTAYALYENFFGPNSESFSLVNTTVSWETPTQETLGGVVEYGLTEDYGKEKAESITVASKTHSVIIQDLLPDKTYHYRITLADPEETSDDQTFTTPKCSTNTNCNSNGNGNTNTGNTQICQWKIDPVKELYQDASGNWHIDLTCCCEFNTGACCPSGQPANRTIDFYSFDAGVLYKNQHGWACFSN